MKERVYLLIAVNPQDFIDLRGQVPFAVNPLCKQHLFDFVLWCEAGFDVFGVHREGGM